MRKQIVKIAFLIVCALAAGLVMLGQTTMTWDGTNWNTTWTGTSCTCDTSCAIEYQTTGGNPDNRRRARCEGKNDVPTGRHEWTGTWETFGVTAGHVVSTVQMTDLDYQYTTDSNCDDVDIGPFELRSSADALVATLWAGVNLTTANSFVSTGPQTEQSVDTLSASNANIELWMQIILDTANVTGAVCESSIDNLDISIVHAAPPTNIINRFLIALGVQKPKLYKTLVAFENNGFTAKTIQLR